MASFKIKAFLEENKIYFEIFSFLFLGTMGLIVSITQWKTAERELLLHNSELLPLFRVDYRQIRTESDSTYGEIMTLSNEGKQIKNFDCEIFSFYEFKVSTVDKGYKENKYYLSITPFYSIYYETNNLNNIMEEGLAHESYLDFFRLYNDCMFLSKSGNFIFINRLHYFKINYIDIKNEDHLVYLNSKGQEISEKEYTMISELASKQFNNRQFKPEEINKNLLEGLIEKNKI